MTYQIEDSFWVFYLFYIISIIIENIKYKIIIEYFMKNIQEFLLYIETKNQIKEWIST